ncbi:MAG: insulinase family protein [Gammaproteobacteria bacterium]|nr:insulinase family protein [Gammaproteobacteria bacterium]MDH5653253.1 insulinase family protein [Gammaproteobacteria bacterium]
MYINRKHVMFSILLGLLVSGQVQAEVHEFELDNGLKILIREDHRAPVVVAQIWYKVGSSYEYNGITGVSHVLEHMMFKGTDKHPAGEFSRIIAANGGRENAFTAKDYTAYFQQLEKSRLAISFEMEADRMRSLTLPEEEFEKELKVVMEERRMRTEDNPRALTWEQFNATAFSSSPYHNPIVGWMDDLKNLKVSDLEVWYRKWYAPNNAVLVVVGDVDPKEVYSMARRYYGGLFKSASIKPLKPRIEAPQRGMRKVTVEAPAKLPFLIMGYKVPVLKTAKEDWEPYALEVLAGILDSGASARFSKNLVRGKQLAAGTSVSYSLYARQDELFVISATPTANTSVEKLQQAITDELQAIKTKPVSAAELNRIKAQVVAGKVYEKDSLFYQAMTMGMLETVGLGWERMEEYADKVRAVTAEQVMQVAKKYLVETSLTVAELKPVSLQQKKEQKK